MIRRNFDHLTFSKPLKLSEYVDQFVVFDSFNIKIEWKSICVSFLMELAKTFCADVLPELSNQLNVNDFCCF